MLPLLPLYLKEGNKFFFENLKRPLRVPSATFFGKYRDVKIYLNFRGL
jgi:hypothetical protein